MRTVTLEELLEAGCHFGHQASRQNPKAKDFIFETRDGIHIIDLEKTKEGLEEAGKFVKDLAKKGGNILVLGTKRQAETILKEELKKLDGESHDGLYFVTKRWIGGTLTNFQEVSKNFKKLQDLTERLQNKNERASYTKKEISQWDKERAKLESFYSGIAGMKKTPDALFVIDTHEERAACEEALRSGTPTVGITDTNSDPLIINYPIPANDDAVGSLRLIIGYILDAWSEGRKAKGVDDVKAAAQKEKDEAKEAAKKAKEEANINKTEETWAKKIASDSLSGVKSENKKPESSKAVKKEAKKESSSKDQKSKSKE
jgi:small subunit ribosomal protein S2